MVSIFLYYYQYLKRNFFNVDFYNISNKLSLDRVLLSSPENLKRKILFIEMRYSKNELFGSPDRRTQ